MRRRVFIKGVLAGSAGVVSTSVAAADALGLMDPQCAADTAAVLADLTDLPFRHAAGLGTPTSENLWPLLAPLRPGDSVGLGWRVTELTVVTDGAAVLTLRSAQGEARVHLCRRDARVHGLAHSEHLDLLLMNNGDGAVPTDEHLARALNVLAELIGRNEKAGMTLPEGLLPHGARLLFYRSGSELL
jgi:hypothetical protein